MIQIDHVKIPLFQAAGHSPSIRCLLSVKLEDTDGLFVAYILVCDGWPLLHFLSKGERIMTISLPSIINTVSLSTRVTIN